MKIYHKVVKSLIADTTNIHFSNRTDPTNIISEIAKYVSTLVVEIRDNGLANFVQTYYFSHPAKSVHPFVATLIKEEVDKISLVDIDDHDHDLWNYFKTVVNNAFVQGVAAYSHSVCSEDMEEKALKAIRKYINEYPASVLETPYAAVVQDISQFPNLYDYCLENTVVEFIKFISEAKERDKECHYTEQVPKDDPVSTSEPTNPKPLSANTCHYIVSKTFNAVIPMVALTRSLNDHKGSIHAIVDYLFYTDELMEPETMTYGYEHDYGLLYYIFTYVNEKNLKLSEANK
jgi:hypothetical protein